MAFCTLISVGPLPSSPRLEELGRLAAQQVSAPARNEALAAGCAERAEVSTVMLKPGDIVMYDGKESEEYLGYVGLAIAPWLYPNEPAWQVDWFFLPKTSPHVRIWFFERNLRKLGEVQHG